MVDFRTNYARDIASRVHTTYGSQIEVFENVIPMSVKACLLYTSIGKDDSQNVEIEKFGEPVVPDFEVPYLSLIHI